MLSAVYEGDITRLTRAKSTTSVSSHAGGPKYNSKRQLNVLLPPKHQLNVLPPPKHAVRAATLAYKSLGEAAVAERQSHLLNDTSTACPRRKSKSEGTHLARGSIHDQRRKVKRTDSQVKPRTGSELPRTPQPDSSSATPWNTNDWPTDGRSAASSTPETHPGTLAPPYVSKERPHHLDTPPSLDAYRQKVKIDRSLPPGSSANSGPEAIAQARDEFLSAHHEKTLAKSKSFSVGYVLRGFRRDKTKSFSWDENTTESLNNGHPPIEATDSEAWSKSLRMKNFSVSVKDSLRRALGRSSDSQSGPPPQQIHSREPHYGRPKPIEGSYNRSNVLTVGRRVPSNSFGYMSPRSVSVETGVVERFVDSQCRELSHSRALDEYDRSRVTSWADSSHYNPTQAHDVQKMPMIQEKQERDRKPSGKKILPSRSSAASNQPTIPSRKSSRYFHSSSRRHERKAYESLKKGKHNGYRAVPHSSSSTASGRQSLTDVMPDNGQTTGTVRAVPSEEVFPVALPSVGYGELTQMSSTKRQDRRCDSVISPSIYSEHTRNCSQVSVLDRPEPGYSKQRPLETGTAFITNTQPVKRYSLSNLRPSNEAHRVTTSNEWRRWAALETAELDMIGGMGEESQSKWNLNAGPHQEHCSREISRSDDYAEQSNIRPVAPYEYMPAIQQPSDRTLTRLGTDWAVNERHMLQHHSDPSSKFDTGDDLGNQPHGREDINSYHGPNSMLPEPLQPSKQLALDGPVSHTDGTLLHNSEAGATMSRYGEERTGEHRGNGRIQDQTVRDRSPPREARPSITVRRRTRLQMVNEDDGFLLKIRRGPYAANNTSPTRYGERTVGMTRAATPVTGKGTAGMANDGVGQENTPPSSKSSRQMVDEFLSSRCRDDERRPRPNRGGSPALFL